MKKALVILFFFGLSIIFPGCPKGTITYVTIKTVRGIVFSFNEHGVFPNTDNFNRSEIGIGIYPDSVFRSYDLAHTFSLINQVYAMENPNEMIFTNAIESLNVVTLYAFDDEHPAGSNVNDILLLLNDFGNTYNVKVDSLSLWRYDLKFAIPPQNDSLQFEITGRITNESDFKVKTQLVVLE